MGVEWVCGAPRGVSYGLLAHAHTGLDEVTDAGLKAFSAALDSSTTITTVELNSKSEWLVKLL